MTRPLDGHIHIVLDLCSLIWGLWRKLYDCSLIASLHSQSMCTQMCSIDIFVDPQPDGRNFKVKTHRPSVWGSWCAHSIAHPWVHLSSLLTFLSGLAGSKSVSAFQPVLPKCDDNYCSRSYFFIEWQKHCCSDDTSSQQRRTSIALLKTFAPQVWQPFLECLFSNSWTDKLTLEM